MVSCSCISFCSPCHLLTRERERERQRERERHRERETEKRRKSIEKELREKQRSGEIGRPWRLRERKIKFIIK